MSRSTSQLRQLWGPACKGRYTTIVFGKHGAKVTVDRRCTDAFAMLAEVANRHGYAIRREVTGAYNCRKITGGSGYSLHAYGIAVDINWDKNPYAKKRITDMPQKMVNEILAIRTKGGHQVFRWGGHYSSVKDTMHYEVVASPAEMATSIANAPKAVAAGPQSTADRSWFGMGDKGEQVRTWQQQLNDIENARLVVDGAFGPATHEATVAFQTKHGLTPDGKVGEKTRAAMAALAVPGVFGRGDKGPHVRAWQQQLNDKEKAGLEVDGVFGQATLDATVAFQRRHGLDADGKVGPKTREAMRAL